MKYVIGIIVAFVIFSIWQGKRAFGRINKLPQMETDEIKALFDLHSNFMVFIRAAEELRKRDVDISFTFPHFLEMSISSNSGERLLGWSGLKANFGENLPDVDTSEAQPSKTTIAKLKKINKQWKERTTT